MRYNLSFRVEEREFASQNDVEIWMIENQFNRRNLPSFTKATLTFALEKRYETRRGANQYTKESGSITHVTEADWPTRKASKAAGMSHNTYAKCKFIDKHADEKTNKNSSFIRSYRSFSVYKHLYLKDFLRAVLNPLSG